MSVGKKTVQKPVYTQVQTGTHEIEVYVTSDGKEWTNEKTAIEHQKTLDRETRLQQIPYRTFDFVDEMIEFSWSANWYYLEKRDDIHIIHPQVYLDYDCYGFDMHDRESYPGWFLMRHEDGGDFRSKVYIYTETYVKEWLWNILKHLPSES